MKVNNRKCINKLSGRLLLANKRRNIITIFAIILTAVLFTSLFTIMLSINATYETGTFLQLGGYAHGTFKNITPAQEEKLIAHRNIKAYGERMVLGVIEDETFKNLTAEISYMDENTTKWSFIEFEEGHIPTGKNEVVMDKEALKLLGYEPVLGESIDLTFNIVGYSDENGRFADSFVLAGYWEADNLCPAHFINVSKEYALDFSRKAEAMGYEPIRTDLEVMLSSSFNARKKMIAAVEESGYIYGEESTDDTVRIGVNPGYTGASFDKDSMLETALPLAAFLLLVVFTGYLIIYNVFQISVTTDIRFYGLLKTIGTTQKQVKRNVVRPQTKIGGKGCPAHLFTISGDVIRLRIVHCISGDYIVVPTRPPNGVQLGSNIDLNRYIDKKEYPQIQRVLVLLTQFSSFSVLFPIQATIQEITDHPDGYRPGNRFSEIQHLDLWFPQCQPCDPQI